jgi:hypothetical protein
MYFKHKVLPIWLTRYITLYQTELSSEFMLYYLSKFKNLQLANRLGEI